ncbi:AI-2E family transporter [Bradyrhizobium vignae]|uniref:AI-2E family transporter n=2 Tax=Bradyrhizobium TaxID=374 RepID=UPI00100B374B|nr:AI-2E family transporter [Bradyrhizobium vignae]RXG90257.1 AI-2E family transporter [Bradyrhizobium vignae]
MDRVEFMKRVAIATIPFLLWYFRSVVLVAVGAMLLSVVLDLMSQPLRWCRLPRAASVALTLVLLFALMGAAGYVFGTTLSNEMQDVVDRADLAARTIAGDLQGSRWGAAVLKRIDASQLSLASWAGNIVSVSSSLFASIVVMIGMGGYIVAQPALYRAEFRKLLPRRSAEWVEMTAGHIAASLKLWCIGQAIQMLLVGALTTLAVWLIGLPSPLALGVIAGLAEFIPYVGPLIAALPALLVATSQGWSLLAWTVVAYVAIQQIEGNLLLPVIQRRLVAIPPATMLFGILVVGAFFGLQGVVFAAPITVMVYATMENQARSKARGPCTCE